MPVNCVSEGAERFFPKDTCCFAGSATAAATLQVPKSIWRPEPHLSLQRQQRQRLSRTCTRAGEQQRMRVLASNASLHRTKA
mmetsp:Transcript_87630/g.165205  ORF Transcript_87630/g.165205 Transcript_87630/m.165205 type:complete len:82 (-) Transcript_87630:4-249(-)